MAYHIAQVGRFFDRGDGGAGQGLVMEANG